MTEYIKREDALKICEGETQNIRYMADAFGKRFECVVGARRINADEIAEEIKKIPSADVVERKKGKWIKLYAGNYKCSVCGDWWSNDDNEMVEDFKYCPNCGADNREVKKNG